MLVLSRKLGQRIVVNFGDQVAMLEVLRIDGNRVRLGIAAENAVGVHREEVWAEMGSCIEPETPGNHCPIKVVA
ncbi:carbon storage regulator [Novipirellula sp. SH528]|uniref:carbon storage regulator n=1 Tax=Novipirellula sp. SH528 TaxID=3454466 RepID=UPI003FA04769